MTALPASRHLRNGYRRVSIMQAELISSPLLGDPMTLIEPSNSFDPFPQNPNDLLRGITESDLEPTLDRLLNDPEAPDYAFPIPDDLIPEAIGLIEAAGSIYVLLNGRPLALITDCLANRFGEEYKGVIKKNELHTVKTGDTLIIYDPFWERQITQTLSATRKDINFIGLLTAPSTQQFLSDYWKNHVVESLNKISIENLIISGSPGSPWGVVKDEDLQPNFPPDRTLHLIHTRNYRFWEEETHSVYNNYLYTYCSTSLLKLLVTEILKRGEIISTHLRISPHTRTEYLYTIVKSLCRNTRLSVEIYDVGCLFSTNFLADRCFHDPESIKIVSAASYRLFQDPAIMVLAKSGGRQWEILKENCKSNTHTFFPILSTNKHSSQPVGTKHEPSKDSLANDQIHVVYAGTLSAREAKGGIGSAPGANIIRYFETMAANPKLRVTIYNAVDKTADCSKLSDNITLRKYFEHTNIQYRRGIAFSDLMSVAKNIDWGFTAGHYQNDFTENVTVAAIGNRFMGYLLAGLPVITDGYLEFQAELIDKFDAGIILDPAKPDQLVPDILNANWDNKAEGAKRLTSYMIKHNTKVLQSLRRFHEGLSISTS